MQFDFMQLYEEKKKCTPRSISPFVLNGNDADPDRYPYMVSLRKPRTGSHYCGGALITPNKVLTAAHCISKIFPNSGEPNPVVRVGGIDSSTRADKYEEAQTLTAELHPDWTGSVVKGFDMAIITLDRNVSAKPVHVAAPDTHLQGGTPLRVAGWGLHNPTEMSRKLMYGDISVIPNKECNETFIRELKLGFITDNMICAFNDTTGTDACQGDSGGPLIMPGSGPDGDQIVGVVSLGVGGCKADKTPAIYASAIKLFDFIRPHLPASLLPQPSKHGSMISPLPNSGCHEEFEVAWQFGICPYDPAAFRKFIQSLFNDALRGSTGLQSASYETGIDFGWWDLKSCSCAVFTRVTTIIKAYDRDEARALEFFLTDKGNILEPLARVSDKIDCAEVITITTSSNGDVCFR